MATYKGSTRYPTKNGMKTTWSQKLGCPIVYNEQNKWWRRLWSCNKLAELSPKRFDAHSADVFVNSRPVVDEFDLDDDRVRIHRVRWAGRTWYMCTLSCR